MTPFDVLALFLAAITAVAARLAASGVLTITVTIRKPRPHRTISGTPPPKGEQ